MWDSALDRYLKKYGSWLAGADQSTAALWLSSNDGNPMTYDGVARAITDNTRATAGIALGAAALTREQTQSNLSRGHRILVYGFDVMMLKAHARQAAGWLQS